MRWPCFGCGRTFAELESAERHEARCDGTPPKRRRAPIQPRSPGGQYEHGKMGTPCRCGHTLAVHLAAGPHPCVNGDGGTPGATGSPCACARFRADRARRSMDPVAVPRQAVTTRDVEAGHEAQHQRRLIARLGGSS